MRSSASPDGIGLFAIANSGVVTVSPTAWLAAVSCGALAAAAILTAIPARLGARRSISGILQAETA